MARLTSDKIINVKRYQHNGQDRKFFVVVKGGDHREYVTNDWHTLPKVVRDFIIDHKEEIFCPYGEDGYCILWYRA